MKAILRLALILLAVIVFAVVTTLAIVKALQASDLGKRLERANTQTRELRGQVKGLKQEIVTLEEKLRELAAQNATLASQQPSAEAPREAGLAQACRNVGANRQLDQAEAAKLPLEMRYKPGVLRVSNDGQSVSVVAAPGGTLKVGPEIFDLTRVQFHRPEGGQVDGKPVALVAYLVHRTAAGQTVVVAVPIRKASRRRITRISGSGSIRCCDRGNGARPLIDVHRSGRIRPGSRECVGPSHEANS